MWDLRLETVNARNRATVDCFTWHNIFIGFSTVEKTMLPDCIYTYCGLKSCGYHSAYKIATSKQMEEEKKDTTTQTRENIVSIRCGVH